MQMAIVNPGAHNAETPQLRAQLEAAMPRLQVCVTPTPERLAWVGEELRQKPAELLIVVGGDGTVGTLLTHFANEGLLEHLPPLLVLPVGRLHTIASVLTGTDDPARTLRRILYAWGKGVRRIRRVPVLRARIGNGVPQWGITASLGVPARLHRDIRAQNIGKRVGLGGLLRKVALQTQDPARFLPIVGPFTSEPSPLTLPAFTAGVLSALPGFFGVVQPFADVQSLAVESVHAVFSELGPMATQASLPGLLRGLMGAPHVWHGELTDLGWQNGEDPDVVVLDGEDLLVPPGARVDLSVGARVKMVCWRDLPLPPRD